MRLGILDCDVLLRSWLILVGGSVLIPVVPHKAVAEVSE